jgi:hypothetical protein
MDPPENGPLPSDVPSHISAPSQTMLLDFRSFRLDEPAVYTWRTATDENKPEVYRLVVPALFAHDFASVPRLLWVLISPFDLGIATIFHDWLYVNEGEVETLAWDGEKSTWNVLTDAWSRFDSDRLLARIMREQNVAKWRRRAAFRGVRWRGKKHWGSPPVAAGRAKP